MTTRPECRPTTRSSSSHAGSARGCARGSQTAAASTTRRAVGSLPADPTVAAPRADVALRAGEGGTTERRGQLGVVVLARTAASPRSSSACPTTGPWSCRRASACERRAPRGTREARMDLELVKPRLRGVLHQYAFFVAIVLGAVLVADAARSGGAAVAATGVYAAGICGLFGVSALYHRCRWSPPARRWMRRLDHAMIFVFIAATYTPVAALVLDGTAATVVLAVVWGGAAGGVAVKLLYIDAPNWLSAALYVALGWVAVVMLPELWDRLGWLSVGAFGLGGLLYTAGAVIWARGRPDPWPQTFGFHEIFHAFVVAAAAVHYAVIALVVV